MTQPLQLPAQQSLIATLKSLWPFVQPDLPLLCASASVILLNSGLNVAIPFMIGKTIDTAIVHRQPELLLWWVFGLLGVFGAAFVTQLGQIAMMGIAGQRILGRLRQAVFNHLQSLPLTYFQLHPAGDLISRITNDTDKLNQLFSESFTRFVGSGAVIIGIGTVMILLQPLLAVTALCMTLGLLIITLLLSPLLQRLNSLALTTVGGLASQLRDTLQNFKVVIAYHIQHFFAQRFIDANDISYRSAVKSGIANTIVIPLYDAAGNLAVLAVLVVGLGLLRQQLITLGLLISFIAYTDRFYQPLRILANIWSNIQGSLAAWGRVQQIFSEKTEADGEATITQTAAPGEELVSFHDVTFGYTVDQVVLQQTSLSFAAGKTYALVGPTGGGKSTFASLLARLYRPTSGEIHFLGKPLNEYARQELSKSIGFILQDPVFFSGTLAENLKYGNFELTNCTDDQLLDQLINQGLSEILEKFPDGLKTSLSAQQQLSLGQRQLAAFLRAILRRPILLILDEATANIDTITEQLLQKMLATLPHSTTQIVIAHRLQTIREADQIFFINQGIVQPAVSYEAAISLVSTAKRSS